MYAHEKITTFSTTTWCTLREQKSREKIQISSFCAVESDLEGVLTQLRYSSRSLSRGSKINRPHRLTTPLSTNRAPTVRHHAAFLLFAFVICSKRKTTTQIDPSLCVRVCGRYSKSTPRSMEASQREQASVTIVT